MRTVPQSQKMIPWHGQRRYGVVMTVIGGGKSYGDGLMEDEPRTTIYSVSCLLFVLVCIGAALVVIDVLSKFW